MSRGWNFLSELRKPGLVGRVTLATMAWLSKEQESNGNQLVIKAHVYHISEIFVETILQNYFSGERGDALQRSENASQNYSP